MTIANCTEGTGGARSERSKRSIEQPHCGHGQKQPQLCEDLGANTVGYEAHLG